MKKKWKTCLAMFLLTAFSLRGDVNEDIGSKEITQESKQKTQGPFQLDFTFDAIGKAKFDRSSLRGQRLRFNEGEADLNFIYYYNPCFREGANIELSYTRTDLDWDRNPFFREHVFNTASVSLGFFSERADRWLWNGQVSMNMDVDHFQFYDYVTWDILLWGRYAYSSCLGLHAGLLAYTGMMIDRVYPIIGFDWRLKERWKLNVVFPVNLSLVYDLSDEWSVAIAGRGFESRHRVGKKENLSKGLFEYRSAGTEIGLNYDSRSWLTANAHIGYNWGGELKVSNRHHKRSHRYDFDGAGYVGGELAARF